MFRSCFRRLIRQRWTLLPLVLILFVMILLCLQLSLDSVSRTQFQTKRTECHCPDLEKDKHYVLRDKNSFITKTIEKEEKEEIKSSKQERKTYFENDFTKSGGLPTNTEPISYVEDHKLCVVVPFRDRFEELQIFSPHLHQFLDAQRVHHQILIMNQVDRYRFNRASLINVGYSEALLHDCDYMAMHDVDLLPLNLNLSYTYPTNGPYHVASPEYHPRYHYATFIGGILIITLDDFARANGLSNKYWGWGLEDDEFFLRLKQAGFTIHRPNNLTTDTNTTFLHIHDKRVRKRDIVRIGEQKQASRRRDRISGLNTVEYRILGRTAMVIEGAPLTVVNVQLVCDMQLSPWCTLDNT